MTGKINLISWAIVSVITLVGGFISLNHFENNRIENQFKTVESVEIIKSVEKIEIVEDIKMVQSVDNSTTIETHSSKEELLKLIKDNPDFYTDKLSSEPKKYNTINTSIEKTDPKKTIKSKVSVNSCKGCHGANFNLPAFGKSKIVKDMTEKEIFNSLVNYKNDSNPTPKAAVMTGQIFNYSEEELKEIAKIIKQ